MDQIEAFIARWRKGDERAAEALYNHFRHSTFRLAYGMLGDVQDAEEVAQDALTYALVNIGRFDRNKAQFSTWLHTITVSRCRDKRRRKRLPRISLTDLLQRGRDIAEDEPGPEQETAVQENDDAVWVAVQQLRQPYREAIILRYWAGHTYREMSEILDCPIPTAQSRVRLAYDKLRSLLESTDMAYLEQRSIR